VTVRRLVPRLCALVLAGTVVAACADTVVENESDNGEVNVGGSFETVPTTTLPIVGSTAELLAEMSSDMSTLSAQISAAGDEEATLARIEAIWAVARPDVESNTPELVSGIETTIDMARTAVVRTRPADGDKAFQLLTDLVDRYTGDG
jgi:outer membrane murein-binding lipoprotein Lpp